METSKRWRCTPVRARTSCQSIRLQYRPRLRPGRTTSRPGHLSPLDTSNDQNYRDRVSQRHAIPVNWPFELYCLASPAFIPFLAWQLCHHQCRHGLGCLGPSRGACHSRLHCILCSLLVRYCLPSPNACSITAAREACPHRRPSMPKLPRRQVPGARRRLTTMHRLGACLARFSALAVSFEIMAGPANIVAIGLEGRPRRVRLHPA